MLETAYVRVRGQTTEYEVADVFRAYGDAYRVAYRVTSEQARVMRDIVACRTAALGGQVYKCQACGAVEFAYHFPYFHVVFTTDHAINAWVPANRAAIYNLLFETASATLKAFAARVLGGELGITAVLQARAAEREAVEKAEYEAKVREREEKARRRGRKPGGRAPKPPETGPRDTDQYNFTDPESRIMTAKRSTDAGFDQHCNVQAAVDQDSLLIVAPALSNHPNDKAEAEPTLAALSPELGCPTAAAPDNGYWSEPNRQACEQRGIEAYIATGREPHHQSWETFFAEQPAPPSDDSSPKTKMAYKLKTEIGRAIYRLRKCTVEPVIGIIKEVLGFRQFSLRGLRAATGEWCLVCLAFNLKRLHVLWPA